MAKAKTTKTKDKEVVTQETKKTTTNRNSSDIFMSLTRILPTIFYIVWIIIGLYFLLVVYSQVRSGALTDLLATPQSQEVPETTVPEEAASPTQTTLEGIGKVNIGCVQNALSPESIQKVLTDKADTNLTPDEKTKLAACIMAEDGSPTPAASPAQ